MGGNGYDPRNRTVNGILVRDIQGGGPAYGSKCPRCGGVAEGRTQPCNCPPPPSPPLGFADDAACVVIYRVVGAVSFVVCQGVGGTGLGMTAAEAAALAEWVRAKPNVAEMVGVFSLAFLRGTKGVP